MNSEGTATAVNAFDQVIRTGGSPELDGGSTALVQVQRLTKRYGEFFALSECSLEVERGTVFGLLGPNGAGKTTLIRSLLGFLKPTSGRSQVCGQDPQVDGVELRKHVAYLPGDARLPRHMRGSGVLRFFSEMHPSGNLERSREIAERLELNQKRHVAFMSTGMRQKLALAVVLSLDTPLLILDEPTANLDPTIRAIVLDLVLEARKAGRTVMFSSHVLSEIEQTCDRVAFLRHGKLVLELNMGDLHQRHRIWGASTDASIPSPENIAGADLGQSAMPRSVGTPLNTYSRDANKTSVNIIKDHTETSEAETLHHYRIDIAGDLATWLPWIDQLSLKRMRIEPLGLRAVYDSVHFGDCVSMESAE